MNFCHGSPSSSMYSTAIETFALAKYNVALLYMDRVGTSLSNHCSNREIKATVKEEMDRDENITLALQRKNVRSR